MEKIYKEFLIENFGFNITDSGRLMATMYDSDDAETIIFEAAKENNHLVFYKFDNNTGELYDPIGLDEFILYFYTSLEVI